MAKAGSRKFKKKTKAVARLAAKAAAAEAKAAAAEVAAHMDSLLTELTETEQEWQNAALLAAAKRGGLAVVRDYLSKGADAEAVDDHGTALFWAARGNHIGVMELLAAAGADINRPNEFGATPLIFASMKGHAEVVEWLLARGADWRRTDEHGHTARALAKQWDRAEAASALYRWVLHHGSNEEVAEMKAQLNDALVQAATTGDTAVLKQLLREGADPNAADDQGWTGLTWAASGKHNDIEAMEELLAAGADVNQCDWRGWTALMAAVDQSSTAEWLLHHDVDWCKVDREGKTALDLARERGAVEVAMALEAWAAKVPRLAERGADDEEEPEPSQAAIEPGS